MRRFLFLLFLSSLNWARLLGDIAIPNTHNVDQNVYLVNADDYPEFAVLHCFDKYHPLTGNTDIRCYRLHGANALLYVGSVPVPRNYIVAISKTLLERHGGISSTNYEDASLEEQAIDFQKLFEAKNVPSWPVDTTYYAISDRYLMTRDSYYFAITKATEGDLTIEFVKRVVGYSNGTPDTVIEY